MFIDVFLFFFKQKTAYEMRISDWSSDVCSSDLLEIDIRAADSDDLARLAQLSQRTNQFNTSLVRCQVQDMCDITRSGQGFHYAVRARDRFGDYGVVGQMLGQVRGAVCEVDLFTLSCRALGRGIETRMIAAAGQFSLSAGATQEIGRAHV